MCSSPEDLRCVLLLLWDLQTGHVCVVVSFNIFRAADSQYTDDGSHHSVGAPYFMGAQGCEVSVPVIIILGTRRGRVVSFTFRSLYSQGEAPVSIEE